MAWLCWLIIIMRSIGAGAGCEVNVIQGRWRWDCLCLDSGVWREVSGTLTLLLQRYFCLALVPGCSLQPLCSSSTKGQETSHVRQRPWLCLGQQKAKQLMKNSFLCLVFPSENFVLSWHTDYRKTEKKYGHCQWDKQILTTKDKAGDRDNHLIMWWMIVLQTVGLCCQLKRSELEWSRAISLLVNRDGQNNLEPNLSHAWTLCETVSVLRWIEHHPVKSAEMGLFSACVRFPQGIKIFGHSAALWNGRHILLILLGGDPLLRTFCSS